MFLISKPAAQMRHGLYFKSPYHLSDIFMTNQRYSFDINVGLW